MHFPRSTTSLRSFRHRVVATSLGAFSLLFAAGCEKASEPYYARSTGSSSEEAPSPPPSKTLDPRGGSGAAGANTPDAAVEGATAPRDLPGTQELYGRVIETYDSDTGSYTYAKIARASGGEAWVAGPKTPLATGQLLSARGASVQRNFPTRQRTFDELWLATSLDVDAGSSSRLAIETPAAPAARAEPVPPAEGGSTIAAVHARAKELEGKLVRVRGRVTRVTPMVGGTWVHLQDGSAEAAADDLTFILAESEAEPASGAILVLEGTLSLDHEMARAHRAEAIVVANAKKL